MDELAATWARRYIAEQASYGYMYLISFHWTLAQFLPAPNDDHPQNVYERSFAVVVLLTGFVVFSSILGRVIALITDSRQKTYKRMKDKEMLRKFFNDNLISNGLAMRITHYTSQQANLKT